MLAPLKATLTERLMPKGAAYRTCKCHGNATITVVPRYVFLNAGTLAGMQVPG